MKTDKYISIVIPLFNEEESIDALIDKLLKAAKNYNFEYEIVLVDDGSVDDTWNLLINYSHNYSRIKGIKFKRNYGQTAAMVAGFDNAIGDIIVTMDGDLQNDPEDIPLLLKKIEEGYDIVSGWRKNRKDHFARVIPSIVANFIISRTTGVHLHDYGCSLKAYRSDSIKSIKAYGEMHRFFPAFANMTGARVAEIPVNHYARKFGSSKYGFDRIFKVFSDILSINLIIRFVSKPLIGFTKCSIPFFIFSVLFGILSLIAILFSWSPGKSQFFLIIAVLMGSSTILLLMLGIIGELVVSFSDLEHTNLPAVMKTEMEIKENETT